MEQRVRIGATVLVAAVIGVLTWQGLRGQEQEPACAGKPLSYWLRDSRSYDKDVPTFTSNAVPFLIQCLESRDQVAPEWYAKTWPRLPQWARNRLRDPQARLERERMARTRAIEALRRMRTAAKPAIPVLIRILKDGDPRASFAAAEVLDYFADEDPIAKQALIGTLKDGTPLQRMTVAEVLAYPVVKDPETVVCLREWLSDTNSSLRRMATNLLQHIQPPALQHGEDASVRDSIGRPGGRWPD